MNISLLANLALTFRVLFVGKTLGEKNMGWFFFFSNGKMYHSRRLCFPQCRTNPLHASNFDISIRNLYVQKINKCQTRHSWLYSVLLLRVELRTDRFTSKREWDAGGGCAAVALLLVRARLLG